MWRCDLCQTHYVIRIWPGPRRMIIFVGDIRRICRKIQCTITGWMIISCQHNRKCFLWHVKNLPDASLVLFDETVKRILVSGYQGLYALAYQMRHRSGHTLTLYKLASNTELTQLNDYIDTWTWTADGILFRIFLYGRCYYIIWYKDWSHCGVTYDLEFHQSPKFIMTPQ